jgi:hypothetical protein
MKIANSLEKSPNVTDVTDVTDSGRVCWARWAPFTFSIFGVFRGFKKSTFPPLPPVLSLAYGWHGVKFCPAFEALPVRGQDRVHSK